jgi:hypothetical protein
MTRASVQKFGSIANAIQHGPPRAFELPAVFALSYLRIYMRLSLMNLSQLRCQPSTDVDGSVQVPTAPFPAVVDAFRARAEVAMHNPSAVIHPLCTRTQTARHHDDI